MNRQQFDRLLEQAIAALPHSIRRHIVNVAIVVEDLPDERTMELANVDNPFDLLGFYDGVPLTARTHEYGLVPPDKISIYRQSILAACQTEDEVRDAIRTTLRHELAHYFGIDDDRLEELGAY